MYESQIRKYETGKANPKIETLQKIANALNVPVSKLRSDMVLFTIAGLKSQETNLSHIQDAYELLNDEGRKEAGKRIEDLTEIERYTKSKEWFRCRMTKEEIEKAVEVYLNDDI